MFGEHQISARRLKVLVTQLPFESRVARKRREFHPDLPTIAEKLMLDLLAMDVEQVAAGNLLFYAVNRRKGAAIPDPLKIPRPWRSTGDDEPRQSSPEELAAFVGRRGRIRYTPQES